MKNILKYAKDAFLAILLSVFGNGFIITLGQDSTINYPLLSLLLLSALIIFCTKIIIRKINYLIELIENRTEK